MHSDHIRSWGYDKTITALLLELRKGALHGGSDSVSWQLLDYVGTRRPWFIWSRFISRLGFAGLTVPVPWKYAILLNPKHVFDSPESAAGRPSGPGEEINRASDATLRSVSTLAHELGHALWNSHGFDSVEEEYYCNRIAARAYWEILLGSGVDEEEAWNMAQKKYDVLTVPLVEWLTRQRRRTRRHPLKPWTWFDRSRPADIVSNIVFLPWINLGVWGHGIWVTNRKIGKWAEKEATPD